MNRIRTLQDPLGKAWGTRCEGADLIVRTGAPGKEKETIKPQPDARAAVAQAQKEEWARLKKGFVLVNAAARPGEPRMHRCLGAGYTGAMPVADFGGRLLCSRNLASPVHPSAAGRDQLVVIDADAKETDAFEAPENTLVWKALHMPSRDLLLLLADHGVLAWSPASRSFETLAEGNRDPASFLSIADERAAWFAQPELIVCALPARGARAVLFRQPAEPQLFSGHSMQMEGALSAQGRLAFCTQPGEVQFVDLSGGVPQPAWHGDFAMLDKLCYTPDGRWLIAKEHYGRWSLHCFDMQAGAPRADWPALGDLANGDFALDPAGARLAIAHRGRIDVYEFATMKPVLGFAVDHVVKRCTIAWIGDDTLGVRTDAGCASLYAVGAPAA
jgi:hypothetical protein